MPYTTQDEIKKLIPERILIQLTDDQNTGSVITENVDEAIANADNLIDGYLRGRYNVPFTEVPNLLEKLSTDISVYNLYSRRPESEMPETVRDRYKDTLRFLEQIQKGLISLGTDTEISPEPAKFKTNKKETDRVFTKTVLEKF